MLIKRKPLMFDLYSPNGCFRWTIMSFKEKSYKRQSWATVQRSQRGLLNLWQQQNLNLSSQKPLCSPAFHFCQVSSRQSATNRWGHQGLGLWRPMDPSASLLNSPTGAEQQTRRHLDVREAQEQPVKRPHHGREHALSPPGSADLLW